MHWEGNQLCQAHAISSLEHSSLSTSTENTTEYHTTRIKYHELQSTEPALESQCKGSKCHLIEKMHFSVFPVSQGSAEALVRWRGKPQHLLIDYFLGNISAKNYRTRTMIGTGENVRDSLFWDTVYSRFLTFWTYSRVTLWSNGLGVVLVCNDSGQVVHTAVPL